MNMKLVCALTALVAGCAGHAAFAEDAPAAPTPEITITGSAAIVSQYRFRGLTQSDNKPAVQASFTVTDKSGFYLATWGSSATAGNSPINIGGTEIDVYGGYTHALGKSGFTVDGGVYGYIYPGATAGNYFEVYGDLTKAYGPLGVKVGLNWAPAQHVFNFNFSSPTRYNMYEYAEFTLTPPISGFSAVTLHSHVGHTGGGFDYGKPYVDYVAGISYKYKALTFDISAVGTSISGKDISREFAQPICGPRGTAACYSGAVSFFHRPAKPVAVASITASF